MNVVRVLISEPFVQLLTSHYRKWPRFPLSSTAFYLLLWLVRLRRLQDRVPLIGADKPLEVWNDRLRNIV